MKIYTRTGDAGSTGLFGGPRVSKDDARIEAYGTVDELNAALGQFRAALAADGDAAGIDSDIGRVQHELFSIGGELATPRPSDHGLRVIDASHVGWLESRIDDLESRLTPLKQFILPAGTAAAAACHVARAVCRRAERRVVTLAGIVATHAPDDERISPDLITYLNRLSDYLFVASRRINAVAGIADVPWVKPEST